MYPVKPTGDNAVNESYIFALNDVDKEPMSSSEILGGYTNKGESPSPLSSIPDANKFNAFMYQMHNSLVWVIKYIEELFTAKLEKSGDTMTGALVMGSNKITSTYTPIADGDVTNKLYVDTAVSGAMWLGETKFITYPSIPTLPAGMEVVNADGSAISRTTYSTLFSLIGTTYGAGDNSTTFNIPDLRGKYVAGWNGSGALDSGRVFGSDQKRENNKFLSKLDYNNRILKDANQTHTATEDGYLYITFNNVNYITNIVIDGVTHLLHATIQAQSLGFWIPITAGQTYNWNGAASAGTYAGTGNYLYFVPKTQTSNNSVNTQTNIALYPVIRIK